MKQKLFGIIAAMLFVLGLLFFRTSSQNSNEKQSLVVENAKALADGGDEIGEVTIGTICISLYP